MTDISELREIVASNSRAIADSIEAHARSIDTLNSGLHKLTQGISRLTGDIRILERSVADMIRSQEAMQRLWKEEKQAIAAQLLRQEKRLQLIEQYLFNIDQD
ncbi:hypothetical protein [Synechococcus elongatus]|uniref:hypothetical protein n=1 Tax=Synechococcus elongatus TaxID=32046 RepID=UPI0030D39A1F